LANSRGELKDTSYKPQGSSQTAVGKATSYMLQVSNLKLQEISQQSEEGAVFHYIYCLKIVAGPGLPTRIKKSHTTLTLTTNWRLLTH
jgi:hypothetical protein